MVDALRFAAMYCMICASFDLNDLHIDYKQLHSKNSLFFVIFLIYL